MPRFAFSILPDKLVLAVAKYLSNIGDFLSVFFPFLSIILQQAELPYSPREYSSASLSVGLLNALFFLALLFIAAIFFANKQLVGFAIAISVLVGMISFGTCIYYPYIIASKRRRAIEAQLIPALQQLLIELKSGVTLFNAMVSISNDYGAVSIEMKRIIFKIHAGMSELDALAEETSTSPSDQFRKVLWQISNALKVGSDVSTVLEGLLADLMRERINQIRAYGQELSPWTMIYMLAAVIMPSLGVTMLIVIIGFLGVVIPEALFAVFIVGALIFQLFFMNFISTRRPVI